MTLRKLGTTIAAATPRRISAVDFSFWYVNGELGTAGSDLGRYSRIKCRAAVPCHSIEVNFAAASGAGESALSAQTSGITIRASIEIGGVLHKAYSRSGSRDIVLDNEGTGRLYVPGLVIPAATDIWINTRMIVVDGQKYPVGYSSVAANGEINAVIATTGSTGYSTDYTATTSGRPAAANLKTVNPVSITGIPYTYMPCVALVGDSILTGKGDPSTQADLITGWAVRALSSDGTGRFAPRVPFVQVSNSGETATNWNTPAKRRARLQTIIDAGASHAWMPLGANDVSGSVSTVQGLMLGVATILAGAGMKVYHATVLPQTTSSDSWATLANQTALSNNTTRVSYNAWVRDGMPVDATTKAAVAVGTSSGVLRVGASGHPVAGWFELADAVESSRDSGKWAVNASANYYTADGIHPTTAGHQALSATAGVQANVTAIMATAV